ncbi:MAG: AAA family ATPase, partial [Bacteroidales bacterium]|nr:AAA family ATPase [Bacteroidales bacterium]
MSRYVYSLSDYRAIKKAEIALDGLTVLAGENGSGKSTLSETLYRLTKVLTEYEQLINKKATGDIYSAIRPLQEVDMVLQRYVHREQNSDFQIEEILHLMKKIRETKNLISAEEYALKLIEKCRQLLTETFEEARDKKFLRFRLMTIFETEQEMSDDKSFVENVFNKMEDEIENIAKTARQDKIDRKR